MKKENPTVKVTEIQPGVFWFEPPSGGTACIVQTSGGLVLIDSGFERYHHAMLEAVRAQHLDPHDISLGFMTHCHSDHTGAMGLWREQFAITVVAHEQSVESVEKGDAIVTGASMPYAGFDEPFVPCRVDTPVRGGEEFVVGERAFTVIAAPGHTPGSIHIQTDDLLFVGDNIFADGTIGWMDVHWGSNPEDYVETLERMRPFVGHLVLPGHGSPYTLNEALLEKARTIVSFHIAPGHGLGMPRAPSQYAAGSRAREQQA